MKYEKQREDKLPLDKHIQQKHFNKNFINYSFPLTYKTHDIIENKSCIPIFSLIYYKFVEIFVSLQWSYAK